MKREKFIFATLLIPFFLFSLNIRLTRLDRDAKAASSRRLQDTKYLIKENLNRSLDKQSVLEKVSSERRPRSVRKAKEGATESPALKILRRIRPENLAQAKSGKKQKKDSFSNQNIIKNFNQGNPLRSNGIQYVPDQVLVKFKSSFSEEMREATVAAYQSRKIRRIPRLDIYQLQTPENVSVEEMLYLLEQNPDVEYAVPNHIRYLAITPDDPLFSQQYALYNPGQTVPPGSPQGIERPDIKAREAWEETMGDEDIIIAIIDSGVDFGHPDLDDKLLSNGYDFVNDDSDPTDDNGHGTLVAGIAAAETNNGEGISGVAWNCKILPIKVSDAVGIVDVATEILGIERAVQSGAHVINISIAGPGYSQPERDAIRNAYNNGVVVVAAAGNAGAGTEYPAGYDECLAVAATDIEDLRTDWSNYGPEIDVAAPGEGIVGPVPTWYWGPGSFPYASGDGTSFSAPHVSGLAALIISIKGLDEEDVLLDEDGILIVEDVMNIIRFTADDVNYTNYSGKDDYIGYGRINMERALVPIIISSLNKKND
jgi:subtilisin family serine protease